MIILATWTDWFNLTYVFNVESLVGVISFGTILLLTMVFQIIITSNMRNSKIKSDSFLSFRLLYVAVAFVTASYLADHLGNMLSGSVIHPNFSIFLSVFGYSIAIFALNLFLLRIINFRTNIRRIIKILAYIEMILLSLVAIVYLVACFVELPESLLDNIIIVFGLVVVTATIFTITSMLIEARQAANKMVKLRLRMAALGTFGILLDGLANIMHIVFGAIGVDDTLYYRYIMPTSALVFYLIFMISYYYSLFPPLWLQRTTGVLPPSFTELMKKQEELKKYGSVSN